MVRIFDIIDSATLIRGRSDRVDWKASFPRYNLETVDQWRERLKDLRSAFSYQQAAKCTDRVASRKLKHDEWNRNNSERIAIRNKRVYDTDRGRALWWAAQERARRKDISFSLELDVVREWLSQGFCQATGLPLDMTKSRCAYSPSIDRIKPELGYSSANSWMVCWGFNSAKHHFAMLDVVTVARAICANSALLLDIQK